MALHTDKYNLLPDEMSKLWCDLRKETSLVTIGDEVVGGQSGFAHIAGGYSAGVRRSSCLSEPQTYRLPLAVLRLPLVASLQRRHVRDGLFQGPDEQGRRSAVPQGDPAARWLAVRFLASPLVTMADDIARSDEMDSLVKFLGRKPTNDAFLKSLLG